MYAREIERVNARAFRNESVTGSADSLVLSARSIKVTDRAGAVTLKVTRRLHDVTFERMFSLQNGRSNRNQSRCLQWPSGDTWHPDHGTNGAGVLRRGRFNRRSS